MDTRLSKLLFWSLIGLSFFAALALFAWRNYGRNHEINLVGETIPHDPTVNSNYPLIKIVVDQAGFYEISLADLKLLDWQNEQVFPENIWLENQGKSIPFWVADNRKSLRFFGTPSGSRYTNQNIYWLHRGSALEQSAERAAVQENSSIESKNPLQLPGFSRLIRLEENHHYNPRVETEDPWLWVSLTAPQTLTIPVDLPKPPLGPAKIRFKFWSQTEAPVTPDHHLLVRVNGTQIIEDNWDGKGWQLVDGEISAGILNHGVNEIEIELPGDTGALAELIALDWIELLVPTELAADRDQLEFISPGGPGTIQGFKKPFDFYDVSVSDSPVLIMENASAPIEFSTLENHRYFALGEQGYLNPKRIEQPLHKPDLREELSGAEYLAVGTPELLQSLQPLLDWRENQGLQTMAVPAQAIYDQFNAGLQEPQAIRKLIEYAQENWTVKPRYLALVGDASYDPLGYQSDRQVEQLPTFFVNTRFGGETASDFLYSVPEPRLDQAETNAAKSLPDIAVGRIPGQTAAQIRDYVEKVIDYENEFVTSSNPVNKSKRVLAIADGSESSFQMDAENYLSKLPQDFAGKILVSAGSEEEFSKKIIDQLNQGFDLVVYFGHGAINMWGKDRLFTDQNVKQLQDQEDLPILLQLTCLTGLFTHPTQTSLTEAFLLQPKTGAVAVLAPTSLTLPEEQSYLSYAMMAEISADPTARLGDLLRRAQGKILQDNPDTKEVVETFLLFGDPALQINLARSP